MRNAFALSVLLITSTAPVAAQNQYQDSGRQWIDSGRLDYTEESDQFADSRLLTQVWEVFPETKTVLYWLREAYTPRHVAHLRKKDPYWGKVFNPRRPYGPYLVECASEKGTVSTVEMESGWISPVINPIGEGYGEARVACRNAGFETNW